MTERKYDIALSFAGEDRDFDRKLVGELVLRDLNVFYDDLEKSELWGKDLYTHLVDVYSNQAEFCIMVLSENYLVKDWTNHERQAAQARAFKDKHEYILPIRLDDTDIPGINSTVGYINAKVSEFSVLCCKPE